MSSLGAAKLCSKQAAMTMMHFGNITTTNQTWGFPICVWHHFKATDDLLPSDVYSNNLIRTSTFPDVLNWLYAYIKSIDIFLGDSAADFLAIFVQQIIAAYSFILCINTWASRGKDGNIQLNMQLIHTPTTRIIYDIFFLDRYYRPTSKPQLIR